MVANGPAFYTDKVNVLFRWMNLFLKILGTAGKDLSIITITCTSSSHLLVWVIKIELLRTPRCVWVKIEASDVGNVAGGLRGWIINYKRTSKAIVSIDSLIDVRCSSQTGKWPNVLGIATALFYMTSPFFSLIHAVRITFPTAKPHMLVCSTNVGRY